MLRVRLPFALTCFHPFLPGGANGPSAAGQRDIAKVENICYACHFQDRSPRTRPLQPPGRIRGNDRSCGRAPPFREESPLPIFLRVLMIFAGVAFGMGPSSGAGAAAPEPRAMNALQIRLTTDRQVLVPGQEMMFSVTFRNLGRSEFRVFEDRCFTGSEFILTDAQGRVVPFEGGFATFSPKANQYLGRTLLLKPGEKRALRMTARLDQQYRLVFSGGTAGGGAGGSRQGLKAERGLPPDYPDRFIGCGRIFPLGKPGRYSLVFHYEKSEADRHWHVLSENPAETSLDNLWLGAADSKAVLLTIQ